MWLSFLHAVTPNILSCYFPTCDFTPTPHDLGAPRVPFIVPLSAYYNSFSYGTSSLAKASFAFWSQVSLLVVCGRGKDFFLGNAIPSLCKHYSCWQAWVFSAPCGRRVLLILIIPFPIHWFLQGSLFVCPVLGCLVVAILPSAILSFTI